MMVSSGTSPDAPDERREETAVITLTDLDLRFADHAARVGWVERDGWTREVSVTIRDHRTHELSPVIGSTRRYLGGALVRVGVRLQGPPVAHAADPAAS
jgi:hypothetical protein